VIDKHRSDWQETATQLEAELDALSRWIESQQKIIETLKAQAGKDKLPRGIAEENRRVSAQTDIAIQTVVDYRKYIVVLRNLLGLSRETFDAGKLRIEDLVAPGIMGDSNSVYQLQNYVAGPSREGLVLDGNKEIDVEKSFTRINYFQLLNAQKVLNNVQPSVSNRPVDFVAVRLPRESVGDLFGSEPGIDEDPIWLYGGDDKQALILSQKGENGEQSYRYIPVSNLRQDAGGKVVFEVEELAENFPLRYLEDKNFAIPSPDRAAWFRGWHSEVEWLNATHKTAYSNAIIGLNEQLDRHPIFDSDDKDLPADENLIRRFRQRQRHLTEADMLVLANNHWNFDVRGFNPGGNHGSFFRVSTNSTFMIAGGRSTGIPRGLGVEQPYDSLSFAPTILRLMGKIDDENRPADGLAGKGFRRFPGRVISEITGGQAATK
jgi:hypothetical protein